MYSRAECNELALVVESPESESMVSSASRFQKRFLDVYAETGLVPKRLDAMQFKDPRVVAPIE